MDKARRILWIINHYAQTPRDTGGIRHFALAKHIQKQSNWKCYIVSSSVNHYTREQLIKKGKSFDSFEYDDVSFLRLRCMRYKSNGIARFINMLQFAYRATVLSSRHLPKPDCVIGSTVHPFAALAGYTLARRSKAAFIYEIRDFWPKTLEDLGVLGKKNPLYKIFLFIESLLSKKSDHIISPLPYAHEYLEKEYGVCEGNLTWVPNGVDFRELGVSSDAGCEWYGTSEQSRNFRFYYFGTQGKASDIDVLLDAMKIIIARSEGSYKKISLTIIGDGQENARLRKRVCDENIYNVMFIAPVARSEIEHICENADAFIFNPGSLDVFRYGISSNKLSDFMAAGKPIVFRCAARNNPVEEAGCGISLCDLSAAGLANAIEMMSSFDQKILYDMGKAARLYAKQNYDYGKISAKMIFALERAVRSRERR
ncbi:glycosyltransferase family 4 protein [Candidatus Hydrogenosomobacter endosymbioticus]|uniref:Glycosyltransferase WbuB n=1 Tax=Candidatus Hydrogenosomobacter endosymbioticus TaxID=2558174 RepID=A0ABN6L301_9PROT|nr:glycosyltransferase family 4 protein [Candidatus Hydrogenosomobacter endosymbioticus]BDB96283.1 glycosyltransferase WbuB [Candidatus Hydrogenosomobacter endosymbioticus]